jgi:predicted MPP superfamily phosphohydrolase
MRFWIGIVLLLMSNPYRAFAQQKRTVLAFASDTQEPMWIETWFLKTDHNLQATRMIFKDVNAIRPAAFFILGDVVSLGRRNGAWKNMDGYIKQTVKDSIPVYATLGNHEVMFGAERGIQNFKLRFPMYDPVGYTEVIDSVAVVLLNSNFSAMSPTATASQDKWYQKKLKTLDEDPAIKCIIVGCHHSPFTNSTIVKPSVAVQQHFVPAFMATKKAVLFLSGHSHNFEHFQLKGKDFLVIGGGGGLHQPLRANNDQMHDLSPQYKPAFHYLEVKRAGSGLGVLSRQLKPDFSGFTDGLSLHIQGSK